MTAIRLIHLADLHLGYSGPNNLLVTEAESTQKAGRYLREVDIEHAVQNITAEIVSAQPPVDIVLLAGDIFHKPSPSPRAITCAARMVRKLTSNNIAVVIIDGNHDTSSILHTGSPTTFLSALGAIVVNGSVSRILRDTCWQHITGPKSDKLEKLAIHALPYSALRGQPDFTHVYPIEGYVNVLLTHGRVSNMAELNSLYKMAHTIPVDILNRGWHYAALGDWHIHRYQPLHHVPAYYAGSLEPLTFGEAMNYPLDPKDAYAVHGAIDVRLSREQSAEIYTLANSQARPLLRLKNIDALDMNADALMMAIRECLLAEFPAHALVTLEILNIHPDVWLQLDHAEIATLRQRVRYCSIHPRLQHISTTSSAAAVSEATLDHQWEYFLEQYEPDEEARTWYKEAGLRKIEEAQQLLQSAYAQEGE
ncbi:hypothetical protein KDH_11800 [Dictyobacter sp. S3.2.2.5]|uniref:Nuclease SbcCD subunit D n=1 Tax=Dictyobacter halimunensis TaxID=3026934 RepID=A0ABQ6FND6_9CHLR|nr:hypothetical protein KDH_11800 [Dictyobacter sp. S3.2.2.5]